MSVRVENALLRIVLGVWNDLSVLHRRNAERHGAYLLDDDKATDELQGEKISRVYPFRQSFTYKIELFVGILKLNSYKEAK